MIHSIFQFCVQLLLFAARSLGLSYEAINVWVFVIIWPALTLVLAAIVIWQYLQIRRHRRSRPTNASRGPAR